MPEESSRNEYNQQSFIGGMNMLLDDTRLPTNQYRVGFNVRNRFDQLDLILSSVEDVYAPPGLKQELTTFGEYEILFVGGKAYYKHYTAERWTQIAGFEMSNIAPRFWTCAVPVSLTNYVRVAGYAAVLSDAKGTVKLNNVAAAAQGTIPGLLVQDNTNQPRFIYLDINGIPAVRTTQTYAQWSMTFTTVDRVEFTADGDKREYVPVGNEMEWVDGILYVTSPDKNSIYRSVSGRPLDFVVNIKPNGDKGGDATTTSYSVGVGGITTLKAMADGSLFVAAGNANFLVAKNMSQNAPMEFGEYTFIRRFLFNANCISDRGILDSVGDTRFVDLHGVRSFNSVQQTQGNEGRNTAFTSNIRSVFGPEESPILQEELYAAAILYNDYELYGVSTIFGPVIAVYDTISGCWVGFDTDQTGGKKIKQFAKIELGVQALFAVTEDNKVYRLYVGPNKDTALVRTVGVTSNIVYGNENIKLANPKSEIKPILARMVLNGVTKDGEASVTPYVNNRLSTSGKQRHTITYVAPSNPDNSLLSLSDVDTMLFNLAFPFPDCEQGFKMFAVLEWNEGSITQFSIEMNDLSPMNPLNSQ